MRNRIFGGIGVVLGGAILVYSLMQGGPQGEGAYAVGQIIGMCFSALLLVVGLCYLIMGNSQSEMTVASIAVVGAAIVLMIGTSVLLLWSFHSGGGEEAIIG